MKELRETAPYMVSNDYKERFVAEYYQTKIRYEKLRKIITTHNAKAWMQIDKTDFLDCPVEMLEKQMNILFQYLLLLEERAYIEKIDLSKYE